MLALTSPAALWALAALALPLALHLWQQPPRTVLVGSVRFLRTHVGSRLHELRWREQWLLAVRLLLLGLLSLWLAGPVWRRPADSGPQRWILLDPTAAFAGGSADRLRALQAAGDATHLLAPGLPTVDHPSPDADGVAPDLWSLLQETDARLPAGSKLTVFSPLRLAALRGVRPALRSRVEWVQTEDAAGKGPRVWIESARASPAPLTVIGESDADALRFGHTPPEGWRLETGVQGARLAGPSVRQTPWMPDSSPANLSILVLHDGDRAEDARYLAAAVRAVADTTGARLDLHTVLTTADSATLPVFGFTFWLSAKPVPDFLRGHQSTIFRDAQTAESSLPGWLVSQASAEAGGTLPAEIRWWRRGPSPKGFVVWTDEHGTPFLTLTRDASGVLWQFASRFHPGWTELPLSNEFPAWLRSLLLPDEAVDPQHDLRRTTVSQARSSVSTPPPPPARRFLPPSDEHDLRPPIWILMALLFALERMLSHRRAPRPVGAPLSPRPEGAVR